MKMTKFLSVMTAALMLSLSFTSCDEVEGLEGGENNETSVSQAFLPKDYADKPVAAWYQLIEKKDNGIKTEAVFLFEDGTFVTTKCKVYTDGRGIEQSILAAGTYKMKSGDYTNGKAEVTFIGEDGKVETMLVEIKDGKMTAMDEVFTKQDNSKLPKASDPSQGGDQGDALEPFFPTDYASKTVKAWYKYSDVMTIKDNDHPENPGYEMKFTAAFYFFDDNLFIATTHTLLYGPNGSEIDQRLYSYIGKYEILEGDFNNGKLKIYVAEDKYVTIELRNGQLVAADADDQGEHYVLYDKQDNAKLPKPSDPTEEYNPGGDDGGDEDSKLAAWYSGTITQDGIEYRVDIILLSDNTVAFAQTRVAGVDSEYQYVTEIIGVGTYKITSGDLTDGTVVITMYGEPKEFAVSNGMVTVTQDGQTVTYYKQDNSKYHGPTDFSDDGDDDIDYTQAKAYLPSSFSIDNIAAWYMLADEEENSIRIEAVFLFADNTLVVTKTKIYAKSDGRDPSYSISATGQYRITEGDYTTGKASVITEDDGSFDVEIVEGILTAMGANFTQMPLNYLSDLTTNGK